MFNVVGMQRAIPDITVLKKNSCARATVLVRHFWHFHQSAHPRLCRFTQSTTHNCAFFFPYGSSLSEEVLFISWCTTQMIIADPMTTLAL